MIQVPFYSKTGDQKRKASLKEEIFGVRVNQRLLELAENAYTANLRHGTASTKTRGEVRGGGRKPWRQKGTGRARAGSIRSPIWRGGGIVFGPRPRDYSVALPEEMKRQALISALSLRAGEKNLYLLEETPLKSGKTKEFVRLLKALPLEKKRTLCVVKEIDPMLQRAAQNLSEIFELRAVRELNAHHVLHWPKILIREDALPVLEARLLGKEELKEEEEKKEV